MKAHTIQRSGGLDRIARQGQLYHFLPPPSAAIKYTPPKARLIGYKLASTFTGFCNYHDTVTFSPIENSEFQSSPEHSFLLCYRVLCKEIFLKRAELDTIPIRRAIDRGQPLQNQYNLQTYLQWHEKTTRVASKELDYYKKQYDAALINGDFSQVSFYVVRFAEIPNIMCSGVIRPEYDFAGRQLQNLYELDSIQDIISFSIIATSTGGAAVFCWLGTSDSGKKLIASLDSMADNYLPHALVRFAFEHFENTFASPDWWEKLPEADRIQLLQRMLSGTSEQLRTQDCLVDDGLRIVNWNITARETNIIF